MTRNHELELVTRAAHSLQKAREAAQASDAHVVDAQQAITTLLALYRPNAVVPASGRCVRIAITNGHRLTDDEAQTVDEDAYDMILDMTALTLRYREDPKGHSTLTLANLRGIGPYRIRILAFMLEHPHTVVCADTVDDLLGETRGAIEPASFTKSISIIRQALGGGGRRNPYMHSVPAWQSSGSNNACAYRLNPEWKYLLIKRNESQKSVISR
jgi:hypothetical protein